MLPFAGTLKGVGKVYIQTVLDCFSRHVWARLYTSKMPVTAVQILNNHVLPFFEEHRREDPDHPVRQRVRVLRPGRTATPTGSSCSSMRSNIERPRWAGPSPTASSTASTAPSSKSISGSRDNTVGPTADREWRDERPTRCSRPGSPENAPATLSQRGGQSWGVEPGPR